MNSAEPFRTQTLQTTQIIQPMIQQVLEEVNLFCLQTFNWAIDQCKERRWSLLAQEEEKLAKLNSLWGISLLNHSVAQGEEEWTQNLIDYRVALHLTDFEGNTPLHTAAKHGACHWVDSLCKVIQVDVENNQKQTPLHVAVQYGQQQFVQELIQRGANLNKTTQIGVEVPLTLNALGLAAKQGEKECIDILIKSKKCNLKFAYPSLGSLIHVAIYFHQFDLLDHLLQNYKSEFDIECRNQDDLTPISFAASLGENECVGLLYHFGSSIEVKDYNERLPIHHAALGCHHDTLQLLAALGSKIEPVDHNRDRPLDLIRTQKNDQAKSCEGLLINLSKSKAACKLLPTPHLERISNLVFKGGGAKGLAYLGALSILEQEKILQTVERVAGTSAGAITAALIAVNCPISKLENLLKTTDIAAILLDHPLTKENLKSTIKNATKDVSSVLKTLYSILETCTSPMKLIGSSLKKLFSCTGLCDGEKFREWLENMIHEQTGVEFFTFGDLAEEIKKGKSYKHLHVFGTKACSNPQIIHIHSNDPKWKDVIVSDAVRLSMSIPGVFKPHFIYIRHQGKRIAAPEHGSFLDGGILYNFPVEVFDQKQYFTRDDLGSEGYCPKFNKQTLGFGLYSSLNKKPVDKNVENVFELLSGICNLYMHAETSIRQLNPYNASRLIEIDVKDVGTLSFGMPDSKKDELAESGKPSTKQFLEKHHLVRLPRLRMPTIEEIAMGPAIWEKHYGKIGKVPNIPIKLQNRLRQSCPFWPNMKIFETHMVILFISHLNGNQLSLSHFLKMTPIFQMDGECQSQIDKPFWGIVTRNNIPGCYRMTFEERCRLISNYPNYQPLKLIEAAICGSFEFLVNNQKLFPGAAPSWMRWTQVLETIDGEHACLGNSDEESIKIFSYPGKSYGGIAAIERFI